MLIHNFLETAFLSYPDKEAVVCNEIKIRYRELFERSLTLATYLQSTGLKKGDVISILLQNCHRYIEIYFAASFVGSILNPINTRLSGNEINYILEDSGSKMLFKRTDIEIDKNDIDIINTGDQYDDILKSKYRNIAIPDLEETDIAHLYYTSGTTGKPKGVPLTHRNVTIHSLNAISEFSISHRDAWLHAAPMFHLADAWAAFAFTQAGATHVILDSFKPDKTFELIEKEKVTISNMIPTMLNELVNSEIISEYDLSSLRVILSGGAPISPDLVKKIIDKFGCDYIQTYGMTETCPYLTVSILNKHLKKLPLEERLKYKSKTGRVFSGIDLKVIREDGSEIEKDETEVGEIIVKGDSVTKGYWKLPKETKNRITNGWFFTGDLATIDDEGYVNIVDRKDDMIITGGENVYSIEVENVLYQHPDIFEAAVIGVSDEKWGEIVKAFVVLKNNSNVKGSDLISFSKDRIAHFKAPKEIEFLEALPNTGSGKITKAALKHKK